MTQMGKNSDIVVMNCYAPMFVNVNPGARQWRPNLIGYDARRVYGSPSYFREFRDAWLVIKVLWRHKAGIFHR